MSYEQRQYQTRGTQNEPFQVGTFLPYSNAETIQQPCVAAPLFHSAREDGLSHVEISDHAVDYFSTDFHYQPITLKTNHDHAVAEAAAYNLYEANQNYACWNEPFTKSNLVQFVPSVNTYTVSSVMPTRPDISSSFMSIRPRHQMERIDPMTLPTSNDENLKTSQVCPICERTFVYQLNFVKHLTAADCCQPPWKKCRKEPDIDTTETFKNNTLPRASRAKKVTRSNSTKSRKRQTIPPLNNHQPEFLPKSEIPSGFLETSPTLENEDLKILQATPQRPIYATVSSEMNLQRPYQMPPNNMFCHFCNLQLSTENLYQRHRLAHALVIQLTRCLELSLPTFSPPNNETAAGNSSNSSVLNNWLTDQIRVNFNDQNWLRLSVREVEQVLGNSNMDVDIRQRHGIRDDTEFQNVVDLLVTQDLNLSPRSECSEVSRIPYFFPDKAVVNKSVQSSEACTSVQYHPSPTESLPSSSDTLSIVPVNSHLIPTSPVYQEAGCSASDYPGPNLFVFNQSEESFNSLVTDLDTVEKQMASLLNTYEAISSECDENFTQPELTFQNVFVDDSLDIFPVRQKTPQPSESVECSLTSELNLDVNLTSCKTYSLSGDVDLLTNRLDENEANPNKHQRL